MNQRRLLMISTDRLIFDEKSAVRARQIEYTKEWDEVHIIVFAQKGTFAASTAKSIDAAQGVSNLNGSVELYSKNSDSVHSISPNCYVYSTESFSKYFYPFDAIKLGRFVIPKNKITDITCQDASLTAMAGVALKKKFKVQLEIQIHEDLSSPYYTYTLAHKIRRHLAYKYLPKANKIRVVSERIKDFVACLIEKRMNGRRNTDHYRMPEIEVRPIAVDTKSIKNAPILVDLHRKYRQFNKIVLMASRFEKEKNIELAIKAWPKILEKTPGAGLLIVGDGSQKSSLEALISKLDLTKNVIIEKWVDKPTLISYYKTADLFLNISLFEGYGMTLVEAHAAGCPIISTDVGVAREMGAILVENGSTDLAKKIIESLQ